MRDEITAGSKDISLSSPIPCCLMGILNVTPDSFSDGGAYVKPLIAIRHALKMEAAGAKIIDIGAESTRPGSLPISCKEQLKRMLPVLEGVRRRSKVQISIDTRSAKVAKECLAAGANIINDISALRQDRAMLKLLAKNPCEIVLMHMEGTPKTMQKNPKYGDIILEISQFFKDRITACVAAGIDPKRLILDPGFGFGKTFEHNLELLRRLSEFQTLGQRVLVGVSRKSFLGRISGETDPTKRTAASIAAGLFAVRQGATILRVHDVAEHADALCVHEVMKSI